VTAARPATLTFLSGPRDGDSVTLADSAARGPAVIGRAPDCSIVLADDRDVSRRHARLVWQPAGWLLEDLGSRNGTFVGEFAESRRIEAALLLDPGTVFRVGNTRLRLEAGVERPEADTVQAEESGQAAPPAEHSSS
jgi:pSer/pThr/pTyr-binding forkhead associated (FHA) protein